MLPGGVRGPGHHAVHVPQLLAPVLPEASAMASPESRDGMFVLSMRGPVVDAGGAEPKDGQAQHDPAPAGGAVVTN